MGSGGRGRRGSSTSMVVEIDGGGFGHSVVWFRLGV